MKEQEREEHSGIDQSISGVSKVLQLVFRGGNDFLLTFTVKKSQLWSFH